MHKSNSYPLYIDEKRGPYWVLLKYKNTTIAMNNIKISKKKQGLQKERKT